MPAHRVRVGHSPDPDDAFMVWALASGHLPAPEGIAFEFVPKDIQTLNERALARDPLEVTALSLAAYARVADRYLILPHGASFGDGYGPVLVAREPLTREQLSQATIAVPGDLTTAFAALRLAMGEFEYDIVPFDHILDAVRDGDADAGLVIHEGQLTHAREGLVPLLDLGRWWLDTTGLPLPLGVNAIRADLPPETILRVSRALRASIEDALKHRDPALEYARQFGRGISREDTDKFVGMYVNALTVDAGERGRGAIEEFLARATGAGILRAKAPARFAPV